MTGAVTNLWRHPIEGSGRDPLRTATSIAGQLLSGNRMRDAQRPDPGKFSQGAVRLFPRRTVVGDRVEVRG